MLLRPARHPKSNAPQQSPQAPRSSTDALHVQPLLNPTHLSDDVACCCVPTPSSSWLSHEVLPVLRQLKQRESLPEEQLGAALAYLEVLWVEASQRAAETDAAHADLQAVDATERPSPVRARPAATTPRCARLRDAVARHVTQLLAVPADTLKHEPRELRDAIAYVSASAAGASTFSPTPPTPTARWRQRR